MSELITELAERVGQALRSVNARLATAESCTGGGIAEAVTRVAGSSAWFERGWVTYSNAAKVQDLDVASTLIGRHGAVSEPVVRAMAEGAKKKSGADWAIAASGIAGPDGGTPEKPVGTVWLAWAGPDEVFAERFIFTGTRGQVREASVAKALSGLVEKIGLASRRDAM